MNSTAWERFRRSPGGIAGLVFLLLLVLVGTFGPVIVRESPWAMVGRPFLPPGQGFLLGTDVLGRDVALGLLHGARASLVVGLASTAAAVAIGLLLGAVAGYFGGWVDDLLMRITEVFQIVPNLVLMMVLVVLIGPSLTSVIVGIAVVSWPNVARIVRAEVMALRHREYVEAARLIGQRPMNILLHEILPNAMPPVIVIASVMVASAILAESALSFLGLGDPTIMTWGHMIGNAREFLRSAWWLSAIPGLAIVLTVLAINAVGDALNDALNPRMKKDVHA